MTHLNRRTALSMVAAVPIAAAVGAHVAVASTGDDALLLALGEQCKALALETRRLQGVAKKAFIQTAKAFRATKPERWSCGDYVRRVRCVPHAWEAHAVDRAIDWFDHAFDYVPVECGQDNLPTKWIRLRATTFEQAKSEARVLDQKFRADFQCKLDQAGKPFNRKVHNKNWSRSHTALRQAVARLAKLKATTLPGLSMKAMVLAVAHDAFDDPSIWNEKLQRSFLRDRLRLTA